MKKSVKSIVEIEIETSDEYNRDSDRDGSFGVIYGAEGVGKTTALRNLPPSSTMILGFDKGVKVIKKMKLGHRVTKVNGDLANLDGIIDFIVSDENSPYYESKKKMFPSGIKFLVIDHFTAMHKWVESAYANRRDHFTLTLKDRGDTASTMNRYMRMFSDMTDAGINVVVLALEEPYDVGQKVGDDIEQIKKIMPACSAKISQQLVGLSDYVGRLVYDQVNKSRAIRMYGSVGERISCKSRSIDPEFNEFPHDEWEEPCALTIIAKDLGYDPEKFLAKSISDAKTEKERLSKEKGLSEKVSIDLKKSSMVNTVTGSTNESKKKDGKNKED